jgi:riboflavin kinase/FMN adenylyltransferase
MTLAGIPTVGPAVVTLGVFDGVHLGHRQAVRATAAAARERGADSVALVFDPPPIEIIRPGVRVERLLPVRLVLERLRGAGIDHAVRVAFDEEMRETAPEVFLAALAPAIELRGVAMTPTSAFGHRRAGTLERVAEIGAERGFDAVAVQPLEVDGEPVSSSRIRAALAAGDVGLAERLLGAPPQLEAELVDPDAPLRLAYLPALPAAGSYPASWRAADGEHGSGTIEVRSDGSVTLAPSTPAPVGHLAVELRAAV